MDSGTSPRFGPGRVPGVVEEWPHYRKRGTTPAIRIDGPFVVDTAEGPLTCLDGWLAIDARGFPYPIAADEFDLIYTQNDPAETLLAKLLEHGEYFRNVKTGIPCLGFDYGESACR